MRLNRLINSQAVSGEIGVHSYTLQAHRHYVSAFAKVGEGAKRQPPKSPKGTLAARRLALVTYYKQTVEICATLRYGYYNS
jgi:hypothetical protein